MGKRIDLTGQRFGKLVVLSKAESLREGRGAIRAMWNCKCDCGNAVTVRAELLRNGKTKSCGCLKHKHSYNFDDLTSREFGRLFVIGINRRDSRGKIYYDCICKCGNRVVVNSNSLKAGHTRSCGCLQVELSRKRHTKHGLSYSKIRGIWRNMIRRCECKNDASYENYGGRGISVCDEWHNLEAFAKWILEAGYDECRERGEQTIERIDVNGNYEPSNCKLANMIKQGRNKRNNREFLLNGKRITLQELSEITGVNRTTISYRLSKGKSVSEATGGKFNENEIEEVNNR